MDPEGRLFLSIGIDSVRMGAMTVIEKRENMFSWLPDAGDPLAKYYGHAGNMIPGPLYAGRTFNFSSANIERKYGADSASRWQNVSMARLASWGFNTIGNWSDIQLENRDQMPYVATIGGGGKYARVPSARDYWGPMPDPFDPAFAAAINREISIKAAVVKSDPWCIGYLVHNELSWGGGDTDRDHYGLAYGALALSADSPSKQAFMAQLKAKYASIDRLNAAWGTSFASWESLEAPYEAAQPLKNDAQRTDFSAFLTGYAEKYFEVVSNAIKTNDANHMYLGCRFASYTTEAVEAAAKYVDVLSFNIYGWNKKRYAFAEKLGKPILIGEFHFGALDRGMFSGGLVPVKDQADRGAHYAEYVTNVLSEPAFIGCHWFEYSDEPTTGRSGDGENYNIGFVSGTDTPYPELIAAARDVNAKVYEIHNGAPSVR